MRNISSVNTPLKKRTFHDHLRATIIIQVRGFAPIGMLEYWNYPMPQGYEKISHPETLVVSKDGRWVYALLQHATAPYTPPSKLLAVKSNKPVARKEAVPWVPLLLLNN